MSGGQDIKHINCFSLEYKYIHYFKPLKEIKQQLIKTNLSPEKQKIKNHPNFSQTPKTSRTTENKAQKFEIPVKI